MPTEHTHSNNPFNFLGINPQYCAFRAKVRSAFTVVGHWLVFGARHGPQ
jgi:hypothetical protein